MKLRTKYLVFVTILHGVALVLSYFVFEDNKPLFFAAEALVLISLVIAYSLFKQLIQPFQTLMQGVEAMKDRDFNMKFVKTRNYEMDQLIDVYNNMMEVLKEERTRQEQQHFFLEKLIHTSPTGILILDHDDKVQQLNPKAQQVLGVNEKQVKGKLIQELSTPVMHEIKNLQSGEAKTITLNSINTFKLQKSHFIDRGFPRSFVMIEELTAEILAAEKSAYGKVIRMMAHEVNNTIGPVNSILSSALKKEEIWKNDNYKSLHHALQVAFDRNQNLNLFMRNFADVVRLPEPVKRTLELQSVIRNVTTLMELKAGEKEIDFTYEFSSGSIFINADEQQMEQVLINVVKNAIEAIEEKGTVAFTTTHHPKKLVVTDTGKGITKENASHLFSPFFSTKKDGQGVGLTLVKEILLNHHFDFSLKTIAEDETQFTINFN